MATASRNETDPGEVIGAELGSLSRVEQAGDVDRVVAMTAVRPRVRLDRDRGTQLWQLALEGIEAVAICQVREHRDPQGRLPEREREPAHF
jgi:hypothetical protein